MNAKFQQRPVADVIRKKHNLFRSTGPANAKFNNDHNGFTNNLDELQAIFEYDSSLLAFQGRTMLAQAFNDISAIVCY